jgi:hypothetical protein
MGPQYFPWEQNFSLGQGQWVQWLAASWMMFQQEPVETSFSSLVTSCSILIPLASSQQNLYDIYLMLYIQYQMDKKPVRNM